jgi:hypothetical protein
MNCGLEILVAKRRGQHWLRFHLLGDDQEIVISYAKPFDLNDNKLVDDQAYRAGRRWKRRSGKHPCSKTPEMHLLDWSDSFEQMANQ